MDVIRLQDRVCGPRVSKANPTAWTKDELIKIAVERGLVKNKTEARAIPLNELCHLISGKKVSKSNENIVKTCRGKKSTKNPNVFTVTELRNELIKQGHKSADIKSLSKDDLCDLYEGKKIKQVEEEKYKGNCKDFTVDKLRVLLRKYSLTASGKKAELCQRLDDYLGLEKKKEPVVNNAEYNGKCNDYTVDKLKQFLRIYKLKVSGKKAELCQRLDDYLNSSSAVAIRRPSRIDEKSSESEEEELPSRRHKKRIEEESSDEESEEELPSRRHKKQLQTEESSESEEEEELPSRRHKKRIESSDEESSSEEEEELHSKKKQRSKKVTSDEEYEPREEIFNSPCMKPLDEDLVLKDYQLRVAKHLLKHRGILAIHPVGYGKTLTAVVSINCILTKYPELKVVFISPKSTIKQLDIELKRFGLDPDGPFLKDKITRYSFESFAAAYKKYEDPFNVVRADCVNKFVIIDESQKLRNPIKKIGESITKIIMDCASGAKKVLLLSATPVVNRPSDIINQIAVIDGKTSKDSIIPVAKFNKYIVNDDEALKDLLKCKFSLVVANEKQISTNEVNVPSDKKSPEYTEAMEVIGKYMSEDHPFPMRVNMPTDINAETTFVMTDDEYTRYFAIQENLQDKYDVESRGSNFFYSALRQESVAFGAQPDSVKIKWLVKKVIHESSRDRKSLIYTAWKEGGIEVVAKALDEAKIPYGWIRGDVSSKNRELFKQAFNEGKIKILIISQAGGTGINLLGCQNVFLMEGNWNSATDEQIIGRAIRLNSHKKLAASENYVKVFRLFLIKPKKLKHEDKLPLSIDQILFDLSYEEKAPKINEFLNKIKKYSIENNDCDCYLKHDPDAMCGTRNQAIIPVVDRTLKPVIKRSRAPRQKKEVVNRPMLYNEDNKAPPKP